MGRILAGVVAAFGAGAVTAFGQVPPVPNPSGQEIARDNRLRQLQQFEQESRFQANPDVPPGQRALIDYGGYFGFNYLSIDSANHDNRGLRDYELVGYARVNLDAANEFFVRGRTEYRDYNNGESFDTHGSRLINPDLDRAYYRFDLKRYQAAYGKSVGNLNLVVEGGRDLVYWANGLVLTEVLDGAKFDIGNDTINVEFIAGVTPTRTVDIDTSRPHFDSTTRRLFYGAMLTAQLGDHHPYAYVLDERDLNKFDRLETGPITTDYDYNGAYFGIGSAGNLGDRLRYGIEAVYEGGNTLSNSFRIQPGGGLLPVRQTRDTIEAWAFDGRLDYLAEGPRQTRYSAEIILASGDHDRGTSTNTFNGNRDGTKDHGFNAFGLLNTGLAFAPDISNLIVGRLGASTFPLPDHSVFRRLQVGTDFFVYGKLLSSAPIDEATNDQRFLGWEPDVYLNWEVASDVTLAVRYGVFFPDHDAFGNHDARQFFYGGVTFAY